MILRLTIEMELPEGLRKELHRLLPVNKAGAFAQGRVITETIEVLRMRAEKHGGLFQVAGIVIK